MKTWQKLLALLMALAMVFALAACDKDKDGKTSSGDDICGEWVMEGDLCDYINDLLIDSLDGISKVDSALPFTITLEFKENGKYTLTTNIDEDDFEDYLDDLCDALVDYMYDMAADNNMSKSELEAAIEAQYGMSLEEYAHAVMEESTKDAVDNANTTTKGYYKLVGDTVYMDQDEDNLEDVEDAEEYMVISVTSKKLTVNELGGDGNKDVAEMLEELGMDLPWKFEKQ